MPFWYIRNTGEVEAPSGPPPPVSRYGSVKRLAPVMVASSVTSTLAERTPGTVMFQNWTHLLPPSTEADSYSSSGMFCSAARYSRMKNPSCFQVTYSATVGIASQRVHQPRRVRGQRPQQLC